MADKLKDTEEYLRTWLGNFRSASEIAPSVQESLDEIVWARQVISTRPTEAGNISSTQIDNWSTTTFDRISTALPQMPAYSPTVITAINSATSSSNTAVMSYIVDVATLGTPGAQIFADTQIKAYRQLQDKHHRHEKIRSLITGRWPLMEQRFDAATAAFQQFLAGGASDAAAAVEMRTVIDGVQGYLYQDARTTPGEKMTWSLMSQRLGRDPAHVRQLANQETIRATLYGHLSGVAKRRAPVATPVLDALWSMYLDHLQAVV